MKRNVLLACIPLQITGVQWNTVRVIFSASLSGEVSSAGQCSCHSAIKTRAVNELSRTFYSARRRLLLGHFRLLNTAVSIDSLLYCKSASRLVDKTEIMQKPRLKSASENACIISSSGRKGVMPVGSFIKQDFRRAGAGREPADQASLVLLPLLPYLLLILKP